MHPRTRAMLGLAAISGMVAMGAGAFGEHGATDPAAKDWLRTSAEYGMANALAVYAAFALMRAEARSAEVAAWLLLAGGVVFSWSLDLMALTGQRAFGAFTPVGGPLLLAGWLALAVSAFIGPRKPAS